MAKTTAALLSFEGSGQVAKTLVYARWRGVQYARRHVVPANPRTTAQTLVRNTFAALREMWKLAPALVVAPWDEFARGRPFTGMNKFVGENLRVVRGELDMNNFIGSPGARGGPPPVSVTAVTGANAGEVSVTIVAPASPPGWAVTQAVACAFPDFVPDSIFSGPFVAGFDAATPFVIVLAGLPAGVNCQVAGWLQWEKPDGSVAYSVGITDQAVSDV